MYTKSDFLLKAEELINSGKYPTLSAYYKVGDPRLLLSLEISATMLAMYSAQTETAQNESFQKNDNVPSTPFGNSAAVD